MNADIRLSVDFFDHPKTLKLERRLGPGAVHALIRLWCFAAKHRSDGCLTNMDAEDIELAARFNSSLTTVERSLTTVNGVVSNNGFVETLLELRWLDLADDGKTYRIHDWKTHNSYAADAEDRSDSSRLSRLSGINRAAYEALVAEGRTGISREEYDIFKKKQPTKKTDLDDSFDDSSTTVDASLSPTPAPTPIPTPIEKKKPAASAGIVLPDWLPIDSWLAFVEMRKKIKKPMTDRAMQLAIQKLDALRNAGHDVGTIIDSSVLNGWQDLYPPRQGSVSPAASTVPPAASTTLDPKRAADIRRTLAELDGGKC
ncbi:MAG: hypothetical protein AB7I29_07725 [Geobacter sp.]